MAECSIDDCRRPRKYAATGWCSTHYVRWLRHGDPRTTLRDRSPKRVPEDVADLAYLAGLIDGTGHVASSGGRALLQIQTRHEETARRVADTLGGKVHVRNRAGAPPRSTWKSADGAYLGRLCRALLPFVRSDSKRAEMEKIIYVH